MKTNIIIDNVRCIGASCLPDHWWLHDRTIKVHFSESIDDVVEVQLTRETAERLRDDLNRVLAEQAEVIARNTGTCDTCGNPIKQDQCGWVHTSYQRLANHYAMPMSDE